MDWTGCSLVEVIPGKVSGVPILKGTRLPADVIVQNFDGGSPIEEIEENFGVSQDEIRQILAYAEKARRPIAS